MNPITTLSKTLLASSVAAAFALTSIAALAEASTDAERTYVDPKTGELKVAPKLLSEMNEQEQALLSEEQREILKALQQRIERTQKLQNE